MESRKSGSPKAHDSERGQKPTVHCKRADHRSRPQKIAAGRTKPVKAVQTERFPPPIYKFTRPKRSFDNVSSQSSRTEPKLFGLQTLTDLNHPWVSHRPRKMAVYLAGWPFICHDHLTIGCTILSCKEPSPTQSSDLPVIYFGHLNGQFDTLDRRSARTVTPHIREKKARRIARGPPAQDPLWVTPRWRLTRNPPVNGHHTHPSARPAHACRTNRFSAMKVLPQRLAF